MSELKCPNIKIYKCSDGFVTDNAQVAKSHEANIKSNKLDDLSDKNGKLKSKLDITVDKLKGIKAYYDDSYADPHTFVNWHIVAQRLANDANDALAQIKDNDKDVK